MFEFLLSSASESWSYLTSHVAFIQTLVPSLLGAGVGAWMAQRIAARNKANEELLKDVRASNAAAAIAYSIVDVLISMKGQCIKPMYESFNAEKARLRTFRSSAGSGADTYNFIADFRTIADFKLPIEHLQKIILERTSASTKVISMVVILDGILHNLETIISARQDLIAEFKRNEAVTPYTYFGLPNPVDVDSRYTSTLQALYDLTDQAISHSKVIADEMVVTGNLNKGKLPRKVRESTPTISSVDYSRHAALLPPIEKYKHLAEMFRVKPPHRGWRLPWRS